jgi:uncharacterized protein
MRCSGASMDKLEVKTLGRRGFALALAAVGGIPSLYGRQSAQPAAPPPPKRPGLPPETPPFGEVIEFQRKDALFKAQPFPMNQVRLSAGPFHEAQEANRAYLRRLEADRLIHNFRVNAGLTSSAAPLGGWEKPDCELRGHFTGHFLSACALMYSSTGDRDLKSKGDYIVAELAKCQQKLAGGYLSAFPLEYFDRLDARKQVWAPFYTVHKIMAGMLDMYQHCGNRQALDVLNGIAEWAGNWSARMSEPHMQDILNTEYGGMNEVLYNLAAITGDSRFVVIGDRFTKKRFFNPLALRRDELRGLHVNTHIPQVIGAARRFELSSDGRFSGVANFFWYDVTSARAYVTGGTSNNEGWQVEPYRLGAELKKGADTTECCCAYNMLKLTRHLYSWTADPRYFDYYERTLFNHRLSAIDTRTGATQYYLSIAPSAWKTFCTENDSFWCCTGTGVEEFSKLTDSIYFHDAAGVYVNLFIPSELDWGERGIKVSQQTRFPESPSTTLIVTAAQPVNMAMRIRIPAWADSGVSAKINGQTLEATAGPGSYLTISRTWNTGDRIDLELPMRLRAEAMPDEPQTQAVLYGPLVLAGDLGASGLSSGMVVGPMGPSLRDHPIDVPTFRAAGSWPEAWVKPADRPLTFRTTGQDRDVTLMPFHRVFGVRYSVYWTVS